MEIRFEQSEDLAAIRTLTFAAFGNAPHSTQTEAAIIDALRAAGALTISLVAVDAEVLVGHVAFSPVTINCRDERLVRAWYGLGPVSVRPDLQRKGIGHALIQTGLDHLRAMNAQGCVVLGDPLYYGRFGFISDPNLRYGNVPPEYFQRLAFSDEVPKGEVLFHPGFDPS
jgi:putative acetyltransferase